jgi:hypothetical protein
LFLYSKKSNGDEKYNIKFHKSASVKAAGACYLDNCHHTMKILYAETWVGLIISDDDRVICKSPIILMDLTSMINERWRLLKAEAVAKSGTTHRYYLYLEIFGANMKKCR